MENFQIVVVGDGRVPQHGFNKSPKVHNFSTGRTWGDYGSVAANLGAYVAQSPYVCFLDDDDEWIEGAGDIMREVVKSKPEVDIWIPGLQYNTGATACVTKEKGPVPGNIAVPTYKVEWFYKVPFSSLLHEHYKEYTDFGHVDVCRKLGAKVDWYGKVLYQVRPKLEGTNGRGN